MSNSGFTITPLSWSVVELESIVVVSYGKALSASVRSNEGEIPVVGSSGVVGRHNEELVDGPCVVVGRKGAAGAVHLIGQSSWPIDTAYFIQPPLGIDLRYLHFFLGSQQLGQLDKSTAIPSLSRDDLYKVQITVAPQSEQIRIVEKLEDLLSNLDAGVAELKAAQRKLAQYRQSLLKAAVGGITSSNAIGYPTVALGELVESIGQGWSPRCDREPAVDDDEWAVIKTTAIQPLLFDGSHNKRLPSNLDPREHLELKVGDLLVTRAGPRSRVGITCLVRATRPRLILCDKAYRIRCHEARINPGFLELVLNAPHVVSEIDRIKSGISDSGLNLTQDRFFTLMIPLPTIAEQSELIDRLAVQTQSIVDQEQAIELALKQSAAQRKNILKAAFAGQLVPQDPNDEPASVLLERIRAERTTQDASGKKRGRTPRTSA